MSSSEDEEEVFFDSVDHLSPPASDSDVFGYGIWLNEPKSADERRRDFLTETGLLEFSSEKAGPERVIECGGTVVSSDCSSPFGSVSNAARESDSSANCAVDDDQLDHGEVSCQNVENRCNVVVVENSNGCSKWWWRHVLDRDDNRGSLNEETAAKEKGVKVRVKGKKCRELTAVFVGQEIAAHEGLIWTMKFSPDGKYLASGGEDGVVRVWRVNQEGASAPDESCRVNGTKKATVVIPEKTLRIEELPLHEFHGHSGDVLDLAWSKSNFLLSSSEDKTVRLWEMGCDECKRVFRHNNYVTCVQFNPTDENYFISGSIDGKVRIWGVSERQVVDWSDARDVVTAICYQPDGKGFIVGSITGTCRFYGASDCADFGLELNAQIHFRGRKRSSSNKITGIKFLDDDSPRVMVSSEDCKVRILNGTEIVHKYKGLAKSRSQMSASLTSNGKHIVSVGEDSSVYVWNYDDNLLFRSSKKPNSVRSCEHFSFEGVSVVLPWSGPTEQKPNCFVHTEDGGNYLKNTSSRRRDSGRFSLARCFSMDGQATWPEEELPAGHENARYDQKSHRDHDSETFSGAWGLVIVTAGWDGKIRTFHNYGLPTSRV